MGHVLLLSPFDICGMQAQRSWVTCPVISNQFLGAEIQTRVSGCKAVTLVLTCGLGPNALWPSLDSCISLYALQGINTCSTARSLAIDRLGDRLK